MAQTLISPALWTALAAAALPLAGCGGSSDSMNADTSGVGMLRVAITDAPSCGYDAVNVTIDQIRVHQSATAADGDPGWTDLTVTPARRINLLDVSNGVLQE